MPPPKTLSWNRGVKGSWSAPSSSWRVLRFRTCDVASSCTSLFCLRCEGSTPLLPGSMLTIPIATLCNATRHILLHGLERLWLVPVQHSRVPLSILDHSQYCCLAKDPALFRRAQINVPTQSGEVGCEDLHYNTMLHCPCNFTPNRGQFSLLQQPW